MKTKHALLPVLLIFFVFVFFQILDGSKFNYEGKDVAQILKVMPPRDRDRLEYFFRDLVSWDPMGFVLLGEKPMSLGATSRTISPCGDCWDRFLYSVSPHRLRWQKSYDTWRKYEHLFPMTRFAFLYEEGPFGETWYLVVNKKNFIQKVEQHADDFERVLQRKVSGDELLEEGKRKPMIREVLNNHDGLLGTLLGYGRDNSHFFHEAIQKMSEDEFDEFCKQHNLGDPFKNENVEIFERHKKSRDWISAYITGSQSKDLELMFPPGFCAILDHPETHHLQERYLKTRRKIIEFYKDKDFLEATLKILTSEREEGGEEVAAAL